MSNHKYIQNFMVLGVLSGSLMACFHPPFNDFTRQKHPILKKTRCNTNHDKAALEGLYRDSQKTIVHRLARYGIQVFFYGDTRQLIIPEDKYFQFNSNELNDLAYPGLLEMIKLLQFYPCSEFHIAAFTDNIGSKEHNQLLSQGRAETMAGFLWANHFNASFLKAEGYGEQFAHSDNHLTAGAASNRRLEIQWVYLPTGDRHTLKAHSAG